LSAEYFCKAGIATDFTGTLLPRKGMTRFRELTRIEEAIRHRNEADLRWALDYYKMRLSISTRKEHLKHWKQIEEKVIQSIENSH
jgi:hypothetical protein